MTSPVDTRGRPLRKLRVSVTDRCNLRCAYCMPEPDYVWLPKNDLLSFEEIAELVEGFGSSGVDAIRLTGGEPLVRHDLPELVRTLAQKSWLKDLSLTTNGVLLAPLVPALKDAGLQRLTVSLDTLRPQTFQKLTRRALHHAVLEGLEAAARAGFPGGIKIDTVVMRGINDDELVPLLNEAARFNAELRFIEYMDVGGATRWRLADVVSRAEILRRLEQALGPISPLAGRGSAPAERFRLGDGRVFGLVASTTAPFCHSCDRARLTADGTLYTCLYATHGVDLKSPLRTSAGADVLRRLIQSAWNARDDRGAQERLALFERAPLATAETLRDDPRLEMHTRGG